MLARLRCAIAAGDRMIALCGDENALSGAGEGEGKMPMLTFANGLRSWNEMLRTVGGVSSDALRASACESDIQLASAREEEPSCKLSEGGREETRLRRWDSGEPGVADVPGEEEREGRWVLLCGAETMEEGVAGDAAAAGLRLSEARRAGVVCS